MSRVHDVGGLAGSGPLSPHPKEEPTFHEPWEGRTFGMMLAITRQQMLEPGGLRPAVGALEPEEHLTFSYYHNGSRLWKQDSWQRKIITTD
jgi:nitrile hydratase